MSDPLVFGRFALSRELERGQWESTWLACDSRGQGTVSLRRVRECVVDELARRQGGEEELWRKANLYLSLQHRHLPAILDSGREGGEWWISSEVMPAESLASLQASAPLTRRQSLAILRAVASVLDFVHTHGIVCLNLRPCDIRVDAGHDPRRRGRDLEEGAAPPKAVIVDAMLEWLAASGAAADYPLDPEAPAANVAIHRYLCPELVRGRPGGAGCDVYALGIIAWELLTGQPPFSGGGPVEELFRKLRGEFDPVSPEVLPGAAIAVLQRCLAVDAGARWPSAGTFVAALEFALTGPETGRTREQGIAAAREWLGDGEHRTGAAGAALVTLPGSEPPAASGSGPIEPGPVQDGAETHFVMATLLWFSGMGPGQWGAANRVRFVHLGGLAGKRLVGRAVEVRGDAATTRLIDTTWDALLSVVPLIRDACTRPVAVEGVFDSSDHWERICLDLYWNERSARIVLNLMASGFEGADARLVEQILDVIAGLAFTGCPRCGQPRDREGRFCTLCGGTLPPVS